MCVGHLAKDHIVVGDKVNTATGGRCTTEDGPSANGAASGDRDYLEPVRFSSPGRAQSCRGCRFPGEVHKTSRLKMSILILAPTRGSAVR